MKMMKKTIFIIIVVLITMSIFRYIKTNHKVEYKVNDYTIKEYFYMNNEPHYDFIINKKNNTYIFTVNEKLNKKKKVIKKIKEFKSNNLVCIVPIYNKNTNYGIQCNLGKEQVSLNYLQLANNKDFNKIYEKAKKYKIKLVNDDSTKTNYKKVQVYKKNILSDHVYYIWNYKGIYVIDNEKIEYKKFLDYDLYDNVMDCVADHYYVLFENNSVNGIEKVYYYNAEKDKVDSFKLKTKLSKNSYINGVVNNLIYVTDKKTKKEYTVNIKKKSITEIDSDQTKYIVYDNGEKKELSKSDYFMQNNYFDNNLIKDSKVTNSKELKKEYNYYYFIEDNKLYKALDTNKNHKILLTEVDDVSHWLVRNREVVLLVDDTIYSYDDYSGLRKILTTNELKYNYENIFEVGKK